MKITFPLPTDGAMHRFCISCLKEGATQVRSNGITQYHCDKCNQTNGRALYFNKHKVWLDQNNELWHESAGVFVRRHDGKFLFYLRTEYPIKLTVPSGHIDAGETPEAAAARELKEETGLTGALEKLGELEVIGDSCSAGADAHKWHAFLMHLTTSSNEITILEEGEKALWLTLDEAKAQGMAFVIEQVANHFRLELAKLYPIIFDASDY